MIRPIIKFTIMIIGVGVSGLILGFGGALIGIQILKGELFGFGELAGALGGMIIGYPLGVIIGLVLVNKIFHRNGSLLFGITGSCLGAAITIGLVEPLNVNLSPNLLFTIFFLLVPLLGTIGFYLRK
jgi:hypothetical protein